MFFLCNAEDDDLEDVLGKVWRGPHAVDVHVLQHRPQHRPEYIQSMSIPPQVIIILYSVADPGCLSDANFFHPGSKNFPSRIPDPHQRIKVF
jgi:hypothetical protein